MEMVDYVDMIPYYPSLEKDSFYEDLYRKKEFYELREKCQNGYFSHQKIVARYLSNWTLYSSLLVIHETGTGKSGVACAVLDGLKLHYQDMKCLYVSNNDTLLENFKNEIFELSSWMQQQKKQSLIYKKAILSQDSSKISSARNLLLKEAGFVFFTYYRFASELNKGGKTSHRSWINQLIILDEVHHLVSGTVDIPEEDKKKVAFDSYKEIITFIDQLPIKKLLLMTATPMRNSPEEIVPLLNLTIPKTETRFPIQAEIFRKEYFRLTPTSSGIPLYEWKSPEDRQKFANMLRGYVSVVKQKIPFPIVYEGTIFSPMEYYRLVAVEMEHQQMQGYRRAYQLDRSSISDTSFYSHSQQASLFVFPDGSFGTQPTLFFQKHLFTPHFSDVTSMKPFVLKSRHEYISSDYEQLRHNLLCLRKLSTTYYSIIRTLLLYPLEKQYVYCDKIHGSGIRLCIQLLHQYFGYGILQNPSNLVTKTNRNIPRLLFLHETIQIARTDISGLIQAFNHPDYNQHGKLVQVVFGTDKTREGISLKEIQHIHISTPDWNFGKMNQAMGRGIRATSHVRMPKGTTIRIYFHCSLPQTQIEPSKKSSIPFMKVSEPIADPTSPLSKDEKLEDKEALSIYQQSESSIPLKKVSNIPYPSKSFWPHSDQVSQANAIQLKNSIDFFRYYRSEQKDRNIKLVDYQLLVSAMDCAMNYDRNKKTSSLDFQPECMYQSCSYSCKGIENKHPTLDVSTYNLFYIEPQFSQTIPFLQSLFLKTTFLSFQDILRESERHQYTIQQIADTLTLMIDTPITIPYFNGRSMYLHQCKDGFYLSENRSPLGKSDMSQLWLAEISKTPIFVMATYPSSLLKDIQHKNWNRQFPFICSQLHTFFQQKKDLLAQQYISQYMTSPYQLEFLRQLLLQPSMTLFSKWIFKICQISISSPQWKDSQGVEWIWDSSNSIWKIQSSTKIKTLSKSPSFQDIKKYIDQNPFGFYGILSQKKFKIRDISEKHKFTSKKTTTTGKECTSFDFIQLLYFLYRLNPQWKSDTPSFREHQQRLASEHESEALLDSRRRQIEQLFPNLQTFLSFLKLTSLDWKTSHYLLLVGSHFRHAKKALCMTLQQELDKHQLLFRI